MKIGLVFSGGGSRGAYQIGVWKAMRELGLDKKVTVVTGTSIGAVNGAAFVQNEFKLMENLWNEIEFEKIFSSIKENRRVHLQLGLEIFTKLGADVMPLKEMIRDYINEDKIYDSSIGYGLVTTNLSKRKFETLYKTDIEKGKLAEYIIASSTFPLFKTHLINKHKFIDGGIFDNLPIQPAVEHYSKPDLIICINVSHFYSLIPTKSYAIKKLRKQINLIELIPSVPLGSILNFEKKRARAFMKVGYKDAIRTLSGLANSTS